MTAFEGLQSCSKNESIQAELTTMNVLLVCAVVFLGLGLVLSEGADGRALSEAKRNEALEELLLDGSEAQKRSLDDDESEEPQARDFNMDNDDQSELAEMNRRNPMAFNQREMNSDEDDNDDQ